jgi:hypothetical protein
MLTALGQDGFAWWAAVPIVGAAAPVAAVLWWLRRGGILEPSAWLASALLTAGGQLLLGVIPGFGIAVNSTSGAGKAVAGVLFHAELGGRCHVVPERSPSAPSPADSPCPRARGHRVPDPARRAVRDHHTRPDLGADRDRQ